MELRSPPRQVLAIEETLPLRCAVRRGFLGDEVERADPGEGQPHD